MLLRNFYIGLALHHRQVLNFSAEGNFIELDANATYEILEGILGLPPQKEGDFFHPRGSSNFGQTYLNGSINRLNTLNTICNKRLDILDLKLVSFPENLGKHKEPPGFEKALTKVAKTNDNT